MSVPAHTALFVAASGLLLWVLSLRTSQLRLRYKCYAGFGGHSDLFNVSRAHGVSLEHLLPLLLMLLLFELCGGSRTWVDVLGATTLLARLIHVGGVLSGSSAVRTTGMTITYVVEGSLVAMLFRIALGHM